MSMGEDKAATLADKIVMGMIEKQVTLFGSGNITQVNNAQGLAKSIAAFRMQLIEDLKKQPE